VLIRANVCYPFLLRMAINWQSSTAANTSAHCQWTVDNTVKLKVTKNVISVRHIFLQTQKRYIFVKPVQFCHRVLHRDVCQGTSHHRSSFHRSHKSTSQDSRRVCFVPVLRTHRVQLQICSLLAARPGAV